MHWQAGSRGFWAPRSYILCQISFNEEESLKTSQVLVVWQGVWPHTHKTLPLILIRWWGSSLIFGFQAIDAKTHRLASKKFCLLEWPSFFSCLEFLSGLSGWFFDTLLDRWLGAASRKPVREMFPRQATSSLPTLDYHPSVEPPGRINECGIFESFLCFLWKGARINFRFDINIARETSLILSQKELLSGVWCVEQF